jgi:hypothetical protein
METAEAWLLDDQHRMEISKETHYDKDLVW